MFMLDLGYINYSLWVKGYVDDETEDLTWFMIESYRNLNGYSKYGYRVFTILKWKDKSLWKILKTLLDTNTLKMN